MPIIELISLILAAAAALAVLAIVVLTFAEVVSWFTQRNDIYEQDEDHIAFTLKQKLDAGEFETVQGIFNKRTSKMAEARKVKSSKYDSKLNEKHKKSELVIWE